MIAVTAAIGTFCLVINLDASMHVTFIFLIGSRFNYTLYKCMFPKSLSNCDLNIGQNNPDNQT